MGPLGPPIATSQITAMTACCSAEMGHAHCLAKTSVPGDIQPFLADCDDATNACVPDAFLATGASEPPATCTAFGGMGVCLSRCIPQVAENEGLLRPDTCAGTDELCVPCISPLDNMPTGACDLLELAKCVGDAPANPNPPVAACDAPATCAYEASCPPVIDPASFTACGDDAHCLDAALITDLAQAAQLGKCADPTSRCVPDTFIKTGGKFVPPTCNSVAGAEGRCLSLVLPAVKDRAALLPQDTCATAERCTPCYDPLTGASTGACNLSCDTGPTRPATTFATCCDNRAHCVPKASIPDDQEDQVSEQECADTQAGSLCVPNQIIAGGPFPTCTAHSGLLGNYTGVCLSDCLDFGLQGVALAKGSCAADYTCAPCEQFGSPTGAPGCPPTP